MTQNERHDECANSEAAFEAEALPHLAKVFRVAVCITPNRMAAEKLVQQTFAQALDSITQLEAETDACIWLIYIMYKIKRESHPAWSSWGNRRIDAKPGDNAKPDVIERFEPPTSEDVTDEDIIYAMRSLPVELQEILLLSEVEALSYKEAARVLSVTVAMITMRLSQARLLLRANLRNQASGRGGESDERFIRGAG